MINNIGKETAIISAIITGVVTFIGIIINLSISNKQAEKKRTTEFITKNRIEWLEKLKEYIIEYNSMIWYFENKEAAEDLSEYIQKLNLITFKIKFHLNFTGIHDKIIIKAIEDLNSAIELFLRVINEDATFTKTEKTKRQYIPSNEIIYFYLSQQPYIKSEYNKEELVNCINCDIQKSIKKIKHSPKFIMLLIQIYLKIEWERVKVEAEKGNKSTFHFNKKYFEILEEVKADINNLQNKIEEEYITYNKSILDRTILYCKDILKEYRIN